MREKQNQPPLHSGPSSRRQCDSACEDRCKYTRAVAPWGFALGTGRGSVNMDLTPWPASVGLPEPALLTGAEKPSAAPRPHCEQGASSQCGLGVPGSKQAWPRTLQNSTSWSRTLGGGGRVVPRAGCSQQHPSQLGGPSGALGGGQCLPETACSS